MSDLPERVAVLEETARDTRAALQRLEGRLERLDTKFDRFDDKLDRRFDGISAELWRNFRWLVGLGLGGFAGLFYALAHGFHWL
jgi:hypothetical protein